MMMRNQMCWSIVLLVVFLGSSFPVFAGTVPPTISTLPATMVLSSSATLNANIPDTGGDVVTVRGFQYGTDTTYDAVISTKGSYNAGVFSASLPNIACNTTYHFRAFATNAAGTATGADQTFTTLGSDSSCGKVTYTYNDYGPQTIRYNGQIYSGSAPYSNSSIVIAVLFQAPDGTQKPYGWVPNAIATAYSTGQSVHSSGTSPDFTQQIYRSGLADSYTFKMVYSTPDPRTLKMDVYITNNDNTDTLRQISMEYFLSLVTPGAVKREVPYSGANLSVGGDRPVSYLQGNWGSLALFTDDYAKPWVLSSATNSFSSTTNTQTSFLMRYDNYRNPGGNATNITEEPILPKQTGHYTIYLRFGSAADATKDLAPEAYAAFRCAYPYLVNWPDRRPMSRWFIADGEQHGSATNPRGYLWDTAVDVYPLTPAKQAVFSARALNQTDGIISRMNAMNPRPQGVIIWDLEGGEFFQYFTYVGYPNKLHEISPEMDAVADQIFDKLKSAGYQVGMTLRPMTFMTGLKSEMPPMCVNGGSNVDMNDVYIATDAVAPYRGYDCALTAACGTANKKYPAGSTSFGADSLCITGTPSPANVAFPAAGASASWVCHDPESTHDTPCSASLLSAACGSAARTYSLEANGFGSDTLCAMGISSSATVSFPAPGQSVNWACQGTSNVSCSANHAAPICGTANKVYPSGSVSFGADSWCTTGVPNPSPVVFPAKGETARWSCQDPVTGISQSCYAENATPWQQKGAKHPYHQKVTWDDNELFNILKNKVAYAHQRWGARIYYVDSTVYGGNGGGIPFNFEVFRRLQQAFPDCIFFPENEAPGYYGAAAPYNQADAGVFSSSQEAINTYPQTFSIIAHADEVAVPSHDRLVESLKDGNIIFTEGIWYTPDLNILKIYLDSAIPSLNLKSYGLKVMSSGDGSGNVISDKGVIHCPSANCTAAFLGDTEVILSAIPESGSVFTGWAGGGCSGIGNCIVRMNAHQSVTATFDTSKIVEGSGDVTGNGAVTMYDAALTLRGGLTPAQQKEADINGDATVDVTDASAIAKKALGIK
ncbi:MAG: dockerin type I repeat-containing protein [Candidatus Omnitrophica bacterium]|nr:dockerin type I repeat-containing protein [Candidatus Omnitrophota bacterium]